MSEAFFSTIKILTQNIIIRGSKKFIKDPENSAYAKIFQDEIGKLMPEGSVITHTNLHNI